MAKSKNSAVQMFTDTGGDKIYSALISKARARIGSKAVIEDPKKKGVHILGGKDGTAFAGAHPRKDAVLLTIRTDAPLKSERVRKVEQVSRNRWHCEMLLASEKDIDPEVLDWLSAAYKLSADAK